MNGKMARTLRKLGQSNHQSKRLLMSLDWKTRTKVRTLYRLGCLPEALRLLGVLSESDINTKRLDF